MRPGWNPTRRNRNIGTAKQGHGQNNRLVIPSSWRDRNAFWGNLTRYVAVVRTVHGRDFAVLVEPTRKECAHACTVDDVFQVLQFIPSRDLSGIEFLILRQPKRKEEALAGCWGRLAYLVEIDQYQGPTIILEAVDLRQPMRWSKSLRPDDAAELERLRQDGHRITSTQRNHIVQCTFDSVRSTQLFRTLFHEVGHWVDYLDTLGCDSRYDRKPKADKEAFAHRYAERLRKELTSKKLIPFPRILNPRRLSKDGLQKEHFGIN
jgi:hypothetical protein